MKKLLFIVFFCLTSCSYLNMDGHSRSAKPDLLRETWPRLVNTNSNNWLNHVDNWFFTGNPRSLKAYHAETIAQVPAAPFANIESNGDFEVQIAGNNLDKNIYITGPADAVQQVNVQVHDNTLYLSQGNLCEKSKTKMEQCQAKQKRVIVRISARHLSRIINIGRGIIYGRAIFSRNLKITELGSGGVMLIGKMNVSHVNQSGTGNITVIGAETPSLKIQNTGKGCVNLSGRVGVENIKNLGDGTVNIIGADTDSLDIEASGKSLTAISGLANVKSINASGNSRVFLYWVNANTTSITEKDYACVGLEGKTNQLHVELFGYSAFAGKFLHGGEVYVKTHHFSHANVTADRNLFATSFNHSGIYYIAKPENAAAYINGYSTIIPVWGDSGPYHH